MLSLPIDAVLWDGKGATVWIQSGKNTYENRMVVAGMETGGRIEIKSGLQAGDIIVTSGAYLLNSEYILRPVPTLWRESKCSIVTNQL